VLKNHQSKNGMRGPMLWYKMATTLLSEDDKCMCFSPGLRLVLTLGIAAIPQSAYAVTKPVFLGLAKQDYICLPVVQQMITTPLCAQLTEKTYDGDHWIVFCHADALAADLHEWVNGIVNTDS
jgi:soluble epoxide hydrolase/lipid-phosphate phosphatase